ncbi:MAG: hypothetical protein IV100_31355 [Myxococcales bacterium]|nr:hypothetical protein [Myxococcales bacterium]
MKPSLSNAEFTYPRTLSIVPTESGYLGALWTDDGTWIVSFDSEGRPRGY